MIKIDFGSGYNPKKGYSSCDITCSPMLDFVWLNNALYSKHGRVASETVDKVYCRNVLHHIPNLDVTLKALCSYLKPGGALKIIDCDKAHFGTNNLLDKIWYRYIIPRPDIYIANEYRDYIAMLKSLNMRLLYKANIEEKEITVWYKE